MANDVQSTPDWLYTTYDRMWHFQLDAAASGDNRKCPRWFGPGGELEDALEAEWPTDVNIWLNPPYSRGNQRRFVEKAIDCARRGGTVVALLPADTSTRLFHDLIWGKWPVEFLRGRVKFNGSNQAAKFGSMIVTFSDLSIPLI